MKSERIILLGRLMYASSPYEDIADEFGYMYVEAKGIEQEYKRLFWNIFWRVA